MNVHHRSAVFTMGSTKGWTIGLMFLGVLGTGAFLPADSEAQLWKCVPKDASAGGTMYTETPTFGPEVECTEVSSTDYTVRSKNSKTENVKKTSSVPAKAKQRASKKPKKK